MSDEIDFENAKPVKLAHEPDPQKIVEFFKGEEPTKLQPAEVTEELLKRLYENLAEAEMLAKLIECDKKDLKELCRGMESIQKGPYVAFFKAVKGRRTVAWEKYCRAQIKDIPEAELAPYVSQGEDTVRLEIRKLESK